MDVRNVDGQRLTHSKELNSGYSAVFTKISCQMTDPDLVTFVVCRKTAMNLHDVAQYYKIVYCVAKRSTNFLVCLLFAFSVNNLVSYVFKIVFSDQQSKKMFCLKS